MLDIVATYHCMQFQGKLTKHTWENSKKPSFESYVGPFVPNLGRQKFFFPKIWLFQSLDIMVSYHHVQRHKKLMIQSWENLVTDGQMGRRTEDSDFIGRCPTNVERPKIFCIKCM